MKVLVLANFGMGLYKFRKELLERLVTQNNEVYVSLPKDGYTPKLESLGCKFIDSPLERRRTNPVSDLKLFLHYISTIRRIKPDVILTYTIKPNVYGGIACRITRKPYISNITGLGTSFDSNRLIRHLTLLLYRIGLKEAQCVFFQNKSNRELFARKNLLGKMHKLIPGSGVNLEQYSFEEYPENCSSIRFLYIGRIMRAKGIEELMEAAKLVKISYPTAQFDLVGDIEEDYANELAELEKSGVVKYHGHQEDVHSFIKKTNATILPSYHEGMANVLLESAASGRPVLASRVPGCMETFDEGVSGFGFEAQCTEDLVAAITKFVNLPHDQKRTMGFMGRKKMEEQFDRNIIIDSYITEINQAVNSRT